MIFKNKLLDSTKNDDRKLANIQVTVAKSDGKVILRYKNHSNEAKIRMASIAKIPALISLISKGESLSSLYCNEYYAGKHNAGRDSGVKDCSQRFSLEETIAMSKNLPLRFAIKNNISENDLDLIYADLIDNDSENKSFSEKIDDIAFGSLTNDVDYPIRLFSSILSGKPKAITLIDEISQVEYGNEKNPLDATLVSIDYNVQDENNQIKIDKYIKTEEQWKTLKDALRSPIINPHGTLNFAKKLIGGELVMGKTGTLDNDAGELNIKHIAGVLSVEGKLYPFSVLIASEDSSALIKNISSEKLLLPILQQIVNSIRDY